MPRADAAAVTGLQTEPGGLVDLSQHLADFDETAAVIVNPDLIITVDSAVAHLAGARGRPVWMMTPRPSDWRWLLDRADSPWYPTKRLFRQPHPGAWAEVVAEVRQALGALLLSRDRANGPEDLANKSVATTTSSQL